MIRVDPPVDDRRRDRVEQKMFARLDAIRAALEVPVAEPRRDRVERAVFDRLTAMRGLDRADSFVRPRRSWVPVAAIASAAALALVVIVALRGGGGPVATRDPIVTRHLVPPGGNARWTSEHAIVEAFGDTAVEQRIDEAGVTLALARGRIDCDVEPRPDRPPFRVIAGDVAVTVVGTRFGVQRTPTGVRVDVTRGKVRVVSPTGEATLGPGEAWSNEPIVTAHVAPRPDPEPDTNSTIDETQIDLEPRRPDKPRASSKDAFEQAARLEKHDLAASARMYRVAASGDDRTYAALALYSLAELERRRGASTTALRVIDEYLRRFPRGANIEELVWLRVDIHRAAKQTTEMNAAARDYLRRFPAGTYAKPAQSLTGGSR